MNQLYVSSFCAEALRLTFERKAADRLVLGVAVASLLLVPGKVVTKHEYRKAPESKEGMTEADDFAKCADAKLMRVDLTCAQACSGWFASSLAP